MWICPSSKITIRYGPFIDILQTLERPFISDSTGCIFEFSARRRDDQDSGPRDAGARPGYQGGGSGIRSLGMSWQRWALYMSRQHPFIDGNKRTSFALAATILNMNGYYLSPRDEDEIFIVLHKISDASISCDIKQIEGWLKRKSRRWQRN
ncbi:MAG TPA: type II toxin-antitoxin system death-on-curing family toxin [Methanothrix soehngenii]|nr:type II toxin-antitoxin system death-on-curing family toxin [Methanothrix soehngenii]